jgi:hypothetical protein
MRTHSHESCNVSITISSVLSVYSVDQNSPQFVMGILEDGGLIEHVKKSLKVNQWGISHFSIDEERQEEARDFIR